MTVIVEDTTDEAVEVKTQRRMTAVSTDGIRSTRNAPAKWEDGPIFAVETKRVGVASGQARIAWFFNNRADADAKVKQVKADERTVGSHVTSKGKKHVVTYNNFAPRVVEATVFTVEVHPEG